MQRTRFGIRVATLVPLILVPINFLVFVDTSSAGMARGSGNAIRYILAVVLILSGLLIAGIIFTRGTSTLLCFSKRYYSFLAAFVFLLTLHVFVGQGFLDLKHLIVIGVAIGWVNFFYLPVATLYRKEFIFSLECFLVISSFLLLVQIFLSFLGYWLDFHNLLYPWSRTTDIVEYRSFRRLSGIFMEPGALGNAMCMLLCFFVALKGRVKALDWVMLAVVPMTLAISSTLLAAATALVFVYANNSINGRYTNRLKGIMAGCVFALSTLYLTYDYLNIRYQDAATDSSTSIKLTNILVWLDYDLSRKLTGTRFGSDECVQCAFVNSNGIAFHTVFSMGAIGFFILFLLMLFSIRYRRPLIPCLLTALIFAGSRYSLAMFLGCVFFFILAWILIEKKSIERS